MESVIAEIAGRDSVAAILKYCEESRPEAIFPTYVRAPTEYGDFNIIEKTVNNLRKSLGERYHIRLENLVVMEDPLLWRALNGRYISLLFKEFGFYTPCLGCHLYMHIMRVPLAVSLGSTRIIAGERESHDGDVKLNQTANALDAYCEVLRSVGMELRLPIRKTTDNGDIERIVGEDWKASEKQMQCVLSGNYRGVVPDKASVDRYLSEFLIPAGKRLLRAVLNKERDYLSIVEEVLAGRDET